RMKAFDMASEQAAPTDDEGPQIRLLDLLTWIGLGKRFIGTTTLLGVAVSAVFAFLATPIYTARTTLIPPGSQQQSGSAAALAALGSLSGLAGGVGAKT